MAGACAGVPALAGDSSEITITASCQPELLPGTCPCSGGGLSSPTSRGRGKENMVALSGPGTGAGGN